MTMPMNLHPQYIVDENGKKRSVVLSIEEYEDIQNILEISQKESVDINLSKLQINSMTTTWDNRQDEAWDEL